MRPAPGGGGGRFLLPEFAQAGTDGVAGHTGRLRNQADAAASQRQGLGGGPQTAGSFVQHEAQPLELAPDGRQVGHATPQRDG